MNDLSAPRPMATLPDLLRAAAGARPTAIWDAPAITLAALDALADLYARRLAEAELGPGAGALIVAVPTPASFAALIGALRAGFVPALVAADLSAEDMALAAMRADAQALIGPVAFVGLPIAETLFAVAGASPRIRLAAFHGGRVVGALTLDAPADPQAATPVPGGAPAAVLTLRRDAGSLAESSQAALIGAAAAMVASNRIADGARLIATLSPASVAGLVGGPLAALIAVTDLTFHAPFDAAAFAAILAAQAPAHVVGPAVAAGLLAEAGVFEGGRIASLTLAGGETPPSDALLALLAARLAPAPTTRLDALLEASDLLPAARGGMTASLQGSPAPPPAPLRPPAGWRPG